MPKRLDILTEYLFLVLINNNENETAIYRNNRSRDKGS